MSPEMKATIRRMFYVEHLRINAIARHVGLHHSTVSRALNQDGVRKNPPPRKPSVIRDQDKQYLAERLEKYPRMRAIKLFHEIRSRGYLGSYGSITRYVRTIRPKKRVSYIPMNFIAGEEAQVDWAHVGSLEIIGAKRKLYCFVITLSWSRASWVDITLDMSSETFLRCHSRAFEFFGGVPRRIRYDNMKTVVIERTGEIIQFHKPFMEYASWYCFEPRVCDPYQPQQKGRVERFIRTMRDGFFNGFTIRDVEEARYQLRLWLFQANKRPWPGGREFSIEEKFLDEQRKLLPLPTALMPKASKVVRSGKIPIIRFDLNQYSIEPGFTNQSLTVFYDDATIVITCGDKKVGEHPRAWGRDQVIRSESHVKALFAKSGSGQRGSLFRNIIIQEIPQVEKVLQWSSAHDISMTRVFKSLARLQENFGLKLLASAIDMALKDGRPTPEIIAVLCRRLAKNQDFDSRPLALPKRAGVSDLTIKPHDLAGYDEL